MAKGSNHGHHHGPHMVMTQSQHHNTAPHCCLTCLPNAGEKILEVFFLHPRHHGKPIGMNQLEIRVFIMWRHFWSLWKCRDLIVLNAYNLIFRSLATCLLNRLLLHCLFVGVVVCRSPTNSSSTFFCSPWFTCSLRNWQPTSFLCVWTFLPRFKAPTPTNRN